MTYHPDQHTNEAKAKRAQRASWRNAPGDPLRDRERIARNLKEQHKYWPATNHLVPVRAVYYQPGLRRRAALRSVQQHIDTRLAERKARYAAEMRESARRHAEAKALAKAGPMPLFEQAAA